MGTAYKVLGQAAPSVATVSITNKALTSNVATLTTSATHSLVVGQTVLVTMTTPDASFDGVWVITAVTSTTFSYTSNNSNVTSAAATGTGTGNQWTTLYTCPAATSMVSSSLIVCNRGSSAAFYQVAVSTATGQPSNDKFIIYNDIVGPNDTVALSIGLTADATNKYVLVSASTANFTFALFGSEIS